MTKQKAIVLAVFTFWPLLYFVMFIMFLGSILMTLILTGPTTGQASEPVGLSLLSMIIPLHLLTIFEIIALSVFYIVYLFKTDKVSKDKKVFWAVIIFLGHAIAMPVFWYLYIWKQIKEDHPS